AAELVHHDHLAVADAEHRHAGAEHLVRGAGAPLVLDAGGAAGEDYGAGCQPLDHGRVDTVERMDLAVNAVLSQAPGDQLGDLAAEVDDQAGLVLRGGTHRMPRASGGWTVYRHGCAACHHVGFATRWGGNDGWVAALS